MIDVPALISITQTCTTVYRTQPVETIRPTGNILVIDVQDYQAADAVPPDQEAVDMVFITVGVHRDLADAHKPRLQTALGDGKFDEYNTWLSHGPSYLHLGGELGSQELALRFMALGKYLGLWEVVTAKTLLGVDDKKAREMAGLGMIYAIGWKE